MAEQWRPVKGCEGLYEVSDQGRVRSVDRVVQTPSKTLHYKGKILKSVSVNKYGHQGIKLGSYRRGLVHVLVAEAFLGKRPCGQEVRHLNGDPSDNRVTNLTYGTRSENQRDQYSYGGRHAWGKLDLADILAIRSLIAEGVDQKVIALQFGISASQVSAIKTRRCFNYI